MRALALLAFVAAPLAAQEAAFLPAEEHPQWQAIGRLNQAGYKSRRMCTATLVAPDRVLTAAHCVLDASGAPVEAAKLRFVAGWFRGEYAALGLVSDVWLPDGVAGGGLEVARDVAVLILAEPIDTIPPLPEADPGRGPVRILGYRWDRPHALSDTGACPYTETGNVLTLTCQATFGNSGGPVLQEQDGAWHVVAVVSAIGGGRTYAPHRP